MPTDLPSGEFILDRRTEKTDTLAVHTKGIFLCDHASAGDNGKINIIGLFDAMGAENLPGQANFYVTGQIQVDDDSELDRPIDLKLTIADPRGNVLIEVPGTTMIKRLEKPLFPKLKPGVIYIFNLAGVGLKEFGDFKVRLYADDKEIGESILAFHKLYEE